MVKNKVTHAKKKTSERKEKSLATVTRVETFLPELMSVCAIVNILLLRG